MRMTVKLGTKTMKRVKIFKLAQLAIEEHDEGDVLSFGELLAVAMQYAKRHPDIKEGEMESVLILLLGLAGG